MTLYTKRPVKDRQEGMLNENKCILNQKIISLRGYRITRSQIKPDPERLHPLLEMSFPQIKTELQKELGTFSYLPDGNHISSKD